MANTLKRLRRTGDVTQAEATRRRRAVEALVQRAAHLESVGVALRRRFQNSPQEEREILRTVGYARGSSLQLHSSFGFALLVTVSLKHVNSICEREKPWLFIDILSLLQ